MWLISLVENLLTVTRIENGTMQLTLEPELIDEVAQEALRHLNRRSAEHTVTLAVPDDLLMAKMDPQLIVQVLINLTDNAIKYTPAGSSIAVSAQRSGETVRVEVADDGPGIPDAAKEKLFEMFYTAQAKRGDGRRGLGLGLSCAVPSWKPTAARSACVTTTPTALYSGSRCLHQTLLPPRRKTDRLYCKNVFFPISLDLERTPYDKLFLQGRYGRACLPTTA